MSEPTYPTRLEDVEYICLICPLPGDACDDALRCPYSRYWALRRKEERARLAGRLWLSAGQVDRMLGEVENVR